VSASAGRKAKVEGALRDALAELIAREVKDPRVHAAGLVSVTRVECNVDLSVASVYVSIFGDARHKGDPDQAVKALGSAAGFLRGPTGRMLGMRHPPELRFVRDVGAQVGLDLAAIIREDEEKARAAGRVPGEAAPKPVDPDQTAPASREGEGEESGDTALEDTTTEREPTRVPDEEPTADLHPATHLPLEDEP
jgi:ribosome-binding factor A